MIGLVLSLCLFAASPAQLPGDDVITPADYASCGQNSFFLICRLLDIPLQWDEAKDLLGPADADGTHSFQDLTQAAKAKGLHPVGLKTDLPRLSDLPMPAIVHVRDPRRNDQPPHLLVLLRCEADRVILLDPPMPAYYLSAEDFKSVWSGNVLLFARDAGEARRLRWGSLSSLARTPLFVAAGAFGLLALGWAGVRQLRVRSARAVSLGRAKLSGKLRIILEATGGVVLLAAVSIIVLPGLLRPKAKTPQCVLPQPIVELGELDSGEFPTSIPIRNDGNAPLAIKSVSSSCTCVSSIKAPERIEPGSTDTIAAVLKVGRGPQSAVLTIETNAGEQKAVLWWNGRYRPTLHPVNVEADSAPHGVPFEKTLKVIYPGGANAIPPTLEGFECDTPNVSIRQGENRTMAERIQSAGAAAHVFGELDVHLIIKPPASGATLLANGELIVRQGDQTYRLGVHISVRFLGGPFTPQTTGVVFSAAKRDELAGQERTLSVSAVENAGEIEWTGIPDWLACDVKPQGTQGYQVRFRLLRAPEGSFSHQTIQLGRKGEPASRVPVVVYCVATQ